jgi:hypothetical protein
VESEKAVIGEEEERAKGKTYTPCPVVETKAGRVGKSRVKLKLGLNPS